MFPVVECNYVVLPDGRLRWKAILLVKGKRAVRYVDGYYPVNRKYRASRDRIKI